MKIIIYLAVLFVTSANARQYVQCCIENKINGEHYCVDGCDVKVTSEDGDHKRLFLTIPKEASQNEIVLMKAGSTSLQCAPTPPPVPIPPRPRPYCAPHSPDCCTGPWCAEVKYE